MNNGMESSSYRTVASYYDAYDSIPFPFVSCACDPEYEMLWCTSQNVYLFDTFIIYRDFCEDMMLNLFNFVVPLKLLKTDISMECNRHLCICFMLLSFYSGQITVTDYGMNIYNHGGVLRGKFGS